MWHCAHHIIITLCLEENEMVRWRTMRQPVWPGLGPRAGMWWSALLSRAQWRGPALAAGHWAVTWLISETQTAAADSCSHHTASRQLGRLGSDLPRMAPGLSTNWQHKPHPVVFRGYLLWHCCVVKFSWMSGIFKLNWNFCVCLSYLFPDCENITNSFDRL